MRYFCTSRMADLQIKLCVSALMVMIPFSPRLALGRTSGSQTEEINLSGIAGPYSFHRFCRLSTDELWAVGGDGTVQYTDRNGTSERQITGKSLNGVYFTNSHEGWVVGDSGIILHTKDRGSNWQTQISGVKEDIRAITCTDESRCWAVGKKGIILRTFDKGEHWKVLKSGTSALLFAVNFVNIHTGWVVGEDGVIVHTTDGGESWERQRAIILLFPNGPFVKPTDLQTVKFVDENRGWVAGTGGIARTVDGGKTWEVRQIGDNAFIGLVTTDGTVLWAISSEGTNYVTKDGGLTWTRVNSVKSLAKAGQSWNKAGVRPAICDSITPPRFVCRKQRSPQLQATSLYSSFNTG